MGVELLPPTQDPSGWNSGRPITPHSGRLLPQSVCFGWLLPLAVVVLALAVLALAVLAPGQRTLWGNIRSGVVSCRKREVTWPIDSQSLPPACRPPGYWWEEYSAAQIQGRRKDHTLARTHKRTRTKLPLSRP